MSARLDPRGGRREVWWLNDVSYKTRPNMIPCVISVGMVLCGLEQPLCLVDILLIESYGAKITFVKSRLLYNASLSLLVPKFEFGLFLAMAYETQSQSTNLCLFLHGVL